MEQERNLTIIDVLSNQDNLAKVSCSFSNILELPNTEINPIRRQSVKVVRALKNYLVPMSSKEARHLNLYDQVVVRTIFDEPALVDSKLYRKTHTFFSTVDNNSKQAKVYARLCNAIDKVMGPAGDYYGVSIKVKYNHLIAEPDVAKDNTLKYITNSTMFTINATREWLVQPLKITSDMRYLITRIKEKKKVKGISVYLCTVLPMSKIRNMVYSETYARTYESDNKEIRHAEQELWIAGANKLTATSKSPERAVASLKSKMAKEMLKNL